MFRVLPIDANGKGQAPVLIATGRVPVFDAATNATTGAVAACPWAPGGAMKTSDQVRGLCCAVLCSVLWRGQQFACHSTATQARYDVTERPGPAAPAVRSSPYRKHPHQPLNLCPPPAAAGHIRGS